MLSHPLLIVLSGLPGTGKSTIARELARQTGAVHLRIDTIEQALRVSDPPQEVVRDHGYRVAYALAADNLRLGHIVIADCVNPIRLTREAWREVAAAAGVALFEVEVVCSDVSEHRRRVETRASDIPGLVQPTWVDVIGREYDSWEEPHLVVDTAVIGVSAAAGLIRAEIDGR